tara:strand:- start:7525 stop:7821 length:297 start_codon:yes stop_codon:yes gene_type:complete
MSNQEPTTEQIAQIGDALAAGQKIEAIRIYREATGKDLLAAKQFVEALIVQLKEQDPEKYAALSASKQGCPFTAVFVLSLVLVGAIYFASLFSITASN